MLVETTSDGWGETGLGQASTRSRRTRRTSPGPVTIAMAVAPADEKKADEKKADEKAAAQKPTRIVVIGNSRFAANGSLGNAGNANLFLNAIHWLTGEEKLVGIAAEDAGAGIPRADAVAGQPDRALRRRRDAAARDHPRRLGLVPAPGLKRTTAGA